MSRKKVYITIFLVLSICLVFFSLKRCYLKSQYIKKYKENMLSGKNGLTAYYHVPKEAKPQIKIDQEIIFHKENSKLFAEKQNFEIIWRGILKIDKSQFYVFSTGSDDDSVLFIDGAQVVNNTGAHGFLQKNAKVFLFKGYHAIDVTYRQREANAYMELTWDTYDIAPHVIPSKNFIPINSYILLDRGKFKLNFIRTKFFINLFSLMIAVFIGYLILRYLDKKIFFKSAFKEGDIPYLLKVPGGENNFWYDNLSIVLFSILLFIAIFTHADYGIGMDEPLHNIYGKLVVDFYKSYFHDPSFLEYKNLSLYGGLFDGIVNLIKSISSLGNYETAHMFNALIGILGILGCWKVGRFVKGSKVAFWSAFFLSTIPVYYGHMFNNPKDIPFAVGYIWSIYYILQAISYFPRFSEKIALKLGITMGLTLGIRVGAFLIVTYFGLAVLLYLLFTLFFIKNFNIKVKIFFSFLKPLVITLSTAYLLMIICWPRALVKPWTEPLKVLKIFSDFPHVAKILFKGKRILTEAMPLDYLPEYLLFKLPELILCLLFLSLALTFVWIFNKKERQHAPHLASFIFLLFTVFFPIIYAIINHSHLYDGMRHFLFVVPPIACLSALVFVYMFDCLKKRLILLKTVLIAMLVAYGAIHIRTMIKLHPAEYVYFNQFIGGIKGAESQFETDYWGTTYTLATKKLIEYVAFENKDKQPPYPVYTVTSAGAPEAVSNYLPSNFIHKGRYTQADFFVSFTRWGVDQVLEGKEIFSFAPFGVKLVVVKDRRALKKQGNIIKKSRQYLESIDYL